MPKPKKGARLGGSPAHQRLILSNLATALFEHGRITTTETKARMLRPVAEKLITKAKHGITADGYRVHAQRQVVSYLNDKTVAKKVFDVFAPRYAQRNGGYTRMIKIGKRQGDAADMVVLELVDSQAV